MLVVYKPVTACIDAQGGAIAKLLIGIIIKKQRGYDYTPQTQQLAHPKQ